MFTVQVRMEKENKICRILAGGQVLLGVILVIVVKFLAPVCAGKLKLESGGEVFMKCHYTGLVLGYFGILLMFTGIFALVAGRQKASVKPFFVAGLMGIVLGICMILITCDSSIGIGVCANAEMACNLTAGIARLIGGLAGITGLCLAVQGRKA